MRDLCIRFSADSRISVIPIDPKIAGLALLLSLLTVQGLPIMYSNLWGLIQPKSVEVFFSMLCRGIEFLGSVFAFNATIAGLPDPSDVKIV